jgi:NADH:ubiquinone oxidoreductase subunit 2 (subunit N)
VSNSPILLVTDPLLPIRILAIIALIAVIVAFIYVLRHLKRIERMIAADNLVPAERGPRNNMVLIICAVPIIVIGLLLFLILNA